MIFAPQAANNEDTKDFPLPIEPVKPIIRGMGNEESGAGTWEM